jgi:hypothetical protein
VLTTDQLQLLFFSSRRRAQDRLLFLYRNRVLDRFYPPAPFGSGKPEAHWLLDEAGALLVAAMHDLERKQLGWQRRDDWGSHPQLAHQLESNRFVTDLIAATLRDPGLAVSEWWPPAEAADRRSRRCDSRSRTRSSRSRASAVGRRIRRAFSSLQRSTSQFFGVIRVGRQHSVPPANPHDPAL